MVKQTARAKKDSLLLCEIRAATFRCSWASTVLCHFKLLGQNSKFDFRVRKLLLHSNSLFKGSTYSIFMYLLFNFHWFTYLGGFAIPWRTWSLANHHQGLQLPLLQWLLALQGYPYCRRPIQIGHALQVWKVTLINYKWFQLSRKIWSSSWTISPSQGKQ